MKKEILKISELLRNNEICEDKAKKLLINLLIPEYENILSAFYDNLPNDCILGYLEIKFCSYRNGDGDKCKRCSNCS